MKKAIALRHVHFEDVGTLGSVLKENGYQLSYLDALLDEMATPAVQQADLLIVLGGPIGACDLETYPFLQGELDAVRQRLDQGLPLLGICLGAQLIARSLGARVYPMEKKEIGYSPLTLTPAGQRSALAGLADVPVLHWHGDQFDLPVGGIRLASTSKCPNQAFAIGTHVLGLQFHLESDFQRIEHWLVGHANELGQAGIDPRSLRSEAMRVGQRLTVAARSVLGSWLRHQSAALPTST